MFGYARRRLTARPALWAAAAGCALLVALPGSLIALVFVRSLTALLLSGDVALAVELLPMPSARSGLLVALAAAVLLGALVYCRLYAVAVWESSEEGEHGWSNAWAATRRRWLAVALHNAIAIGAVVFLIALVFLLTATLGSGSDEAGTLIAVSGAGGILVTRTILRVYVTLAVRASLLEAKGVGAAWSKAANVVRTRKRLVVAAWVSLVAIGVSVWITGRLVSPILQDTAFDYPYDSAYALWRESAQLALAVPLETFVMALAIAGWTAVFLGREEEREATREQRQGVMVPALAVLVVLAIVANGVPAMIDVAFRRAEDRRADSVRSAEIEPQRVVDASASLEGAPGYRVRASLEGDRLRWTTDIRFANGEEVALEDLVVNVYPAAFTEDIDSMPLAPDLLAAPLATIVRGRASPGTFEVTDVRDESGALRWQLTDTALRIRFEAPLRPEAVKTVTVSLQADLPEWPARFGVWERTTMLGNWIPTIAPREGNEWRVDRYGDVGDPFFSGVASYDVEIETDRDLSVVGTGTATDVILDGDRTTWRFAAPAVRDAAYAIGRFVRGLEERVAGVTIRSWYPSEETIAGKAHLDEAVSAVATYTELFGGLPVEEVDVVATDGLLGGMEYPGVVFLSPGYAELEAVPLLPDLVRYAGFEDEQRRYLVGHEIAHQWWYSMVGNDQIREPWLDEGFAEMSTQLWLEREGHEETWTMTHLRTGASAEPGVVDARVTDFASNGPYTDAVYESGGEVLLRLRELMGEERFLTLIRTWYRDNQGGIGTIDAFAEVVERVGGADAAEFFERYRGAR